MAYVNYNPALGQAQKQQSSWGPLSYRTDQLNKAAGLDLFGRDMSQQLAPETGYVMGPDGLPALTQDGQPIPLPETPEQLAAKEAQQRWMNGEKDPRYTSALQQAQAQRDASQVYQQLGSLESKGLNFSNKALDSAANRETIAARLGEYGIDDLQALGSMMVDGKPVFYNKNTGQALPGELGYTSYGNGFTRYKMQALPNGGAIPVPAWEDSSDKGKIAQGLSIAAMLAAPWALPALGAAAGIGSMGAGALYGGATGALSSGIAGGNVLKGGLTGALAGGIGGAIGGGAGQFDVSQGVGGMTGKAINSAASGALTGGLKSGMSGQNALQGALMGGAMGGLGSYTNSLLQSTGLGPKMAGFGTSQIMGQVQNPLAQLLGQQQQRPQAARQPAQQPMVDTQRQQAQASQFAPAQLFANRIRGV